MISLYKNSFAGLSREIWLLSIVMLINRSGMMVIPFLTLYATDDLGFSVVRAGLLTGSFGAGSLVGSWLGGWLSDRFGTYKVMLWSLFLGGFGLLTLWMFRDFWVLITAIFIVSTIADAVRPATMSSVKIYSKKENQTRSISLIRMAINLGISIGPAVGGIIAGTLGYKWLFVLDGLTCVFAAAFLLFSLPEKKRIPIQEEEVTESKLSAYTDTTYLLFILVSLFNFTAFFQILSTVPLFFEEVLHMSEAQIGFFFTINGLLIFLFEMPIVYLAEKRNNQMFWIIFGAAVIGFGYYFLNLQVHWLLPFLAYTLFVSFGEIFNFPFTSSISLLRGSRGNVGQYMGLYSMMFSLCFIIAPILGTRIIESWGYTTLWWTVGTMNLISALGYYLISERMLK